MLCALYSIVEEVGVARTVEEKVLFVKQSGGFAEVTCFKGQVTERTKKWVFSIFKSVLVLFSSLLSPFQGVSCTYTKY